MSQTVHTKYKWPPPATEWKPHENVLRTLLRMINRYADYNYVFR